MEPDASALIEMMEKCWRSMQPVGAGPSVVYVPLRLVAPRQVIRRRGRKFVIAAGLLRRHAAEVRQFSAERGISIQGVEPIPG